MQRSYSEKSSKSSNGPGPNVPRVARAPAASAGRRQRGHLAVRRVDDHRRIAERAKAELVAQERADVDREVAAALDFLRALREFLLCQRRAVPLVARPSHRHAAEVVGAPSAFEARVPPRGARRLPALVDISRGRRLGRHASAAPRPAPQRCPERRRLPSDPPTASARIVLFPRLIGMAHPLSGRRYGLTIIDR